MHVVVVEKYQLLQLETFLLNTELLDTRVSPMTVAEKMRQTQIFFQMFSFATNSDWKLLLKKKDEKERNEWRHMNRAHTGVVKDHFHTLSQRPDLQPCWWDLGGRLADALSQAAPHAAPALFPLKGNPKRTGTICCYWSDAELEKRKRKILLHAWCILIENFMDIQKIFLKVFFVCLFVFEASAVFIERQQYYPSFYLGHQTMGTWWIVRQAECTWVQPARTRTLCTRTHCTHCCKLSPM